MNDILIISHYYPPEMGAASNRIYQLANGLKGDFSITVLTPLPNYPEGKIFKGYRGKFRDYSTEDKIKIKRLWIFPSNSKNKIIRLLSMLSYCMSLMIFFIFNSIPKIVIVQSPPLLVAFTSVLCLRSRHRKIILNISDLWPDAGIDLGVFNKGRFYSILKRLELYNYNHSQLILGQSKEILNHVHSISSSSKLFLYRNYPKTNYVHRNDLHQKRHSKSRKIVYAGLLGVAQGIVRLCKELDYSDIEFHIYGSGPETQELIDFISMNSELPIFFHGMINRHQLHQELVTYDIAIIPLVQRIYGSVPSKIFELASLGIPVLYFGGGEGEDIVRENNLGWVVSPMDYISLNKVIQKDISEEFGKIDRESIRNTFKTKFNYDAQIELLKQKLS